MRSVSVVYLPPDADASCEPPTVLKNNFLTRPFTMLVEMYGLPEYKGYNPTAFVAITYTLLFGIMFGDLGQGLLIVLGGLALKKKLGSKNKRSCHTPWNIKYDIRHSLWFVLRL